MMRVSERGVDNIKKSEELRLKAYLDFAGVPTIGWGHTSRAGPPEVTHTDVSMGRTITREEAETILRNDIANVAEAEIARLITVPLNQNQFDALAEWTFNLGGGNLEISTLRKVLNAGQYDQVPAQMMRWVKATDPKTKELVTVEGLVNRRKREARLWMTPVTTPADPPAPPPTVPPAPGVGLNDRVYAFMEEVGASELSITFRK